MIAKDQKSQEKIAAYLQRRKQSIAPSFAGTIPLSASDAPTEASEEQQQIWLHAQFAGHSPIYNEPVTISYSGYLDVTAVEKALNWLVNSHGALRTGFEWRNGMLLQTVLPTTALRVPFVDLSKLPEPQRPERDMALATESARLPFSLEDPPLVRALLVRCSDTDYKLHITLHHIVFDGFSLYRIVIPDFLYAYRELAAGRTPAIRPERTRYADYAQWRNKAIRQGQVDRHLDYWEQELSEIVPAVKFGSKRACEARTFEGTAQCFFVESTLAVRLDRLANQLNASKFAVMLSAVQVLLYHRTGVCRLPIGTPVSNRSHEDTQKIVGLFTNTVIVQTDHSHNTAFVELVKSTRDKVLNALLHESAPFSAVVQRLRRRRDTRANPAFQTMLAMEPSLSMPESNWTVDCCHVDTQTAKFDLLLVIDWRENLFSGRFVFSNDLFTTSDMETIRRDWLRILELISAKPDQTLEEISASLSDKSRDKRQDHIQRFRKLFGSKA